MGKYKYLNAAEVQSEIEKFGTEDEREIIDKICGEPDWDDCPYCESSRSGQHLAEADLNVLEDEMEKLQESTKVAWEKLLSASKPLDDAVQELEE